MAHYVWSQILQVSSLLSKYFPGSHAVHSVAEFTHSTQFELQDIQSLLLFKNFPASQESHLLSLLQVLHSSLQLTMQESADPEQVAHSVLSQIKQSVLVA